MNFFLTQVFFVNIIIYNIGGFIMNTIYHFGNALISGKRFTSLL